MRTPARLFDRNRRTPYGAGEPRSRIVETAAPTPEALAREELVLGAIRRQPGTFAELATRTGLSDIQTLATLYVLAESGRTVLLNTIYSATGKA